MISRGASAGARIPHAAAAPLPPSVPGLLMHFDGDFVDECRGRNIEIVGDFDLVDDCLTTDAYAGSHASWATNGSFPILARTSQFPEDFNVGAGGSMTIEYFASTKPLVAANSIAANGIAVEFLDADDETPGAFIWSLRHGTGEFESFVYTDTSEVKRGKSRWNGIPGGDDLPGPWTHIAVVVTPTEIRLYTNGVQRNIEPPTLYAPMKVATSGVLVVAVSDTVRVDDLRILPQEVYTGSSFTPPTAPLSRTHPPT